MNNKAIILAAGIGSRLYPLTEQYPKSLIKVNGRAILDYQIQGYIQAGIEEENIYIVTGYKHEMIADYLKNNYPNVNEIYSPNYLCTNNMYSLYLGLQEISKMNFNCFDYLFINNADCLYDEQIIYQLVHSDFESAIAIEKGTYIEESMKVVQNNDHSLINIAKTISEKDSIGVSIDLYKYSSKAVAKLFEIVKDYIEIKKDLKQWTEVAFPELFKTEKVYPFDIRHKKWVEVDNNEDLLLADKLFSSFDIHSKTALICDIDGTLCLGGEPITDAINYLKTNQNLKYFFLSNNTSKIPQDYVDKLSCLGIKTNVDCILSPLTLLINYIKEKEYQSVYLIANTKVSKYLQSVLPNVKFEYNPASNQMLALTYDNEITYNKLQNACYLLCNTSIDYVATHSDIYCPIKDGAIPDIGCYINMFKLTTTKTPNVILGKPSLEIVKELLEQYNTNNLAVVGDRLYTDKQLADNMNVDFISVLSGETSRLDIQNYQGKYPAIVLKSLVF